MDIHQSTSYIIDASDEVIAVGGDWDQFAIENNCPPEFYSNAVINRSFWDFVSGEMLQHIYRRILIKVRNGESVNFSLRCDSPELRRFSSIQITPIGEGRVEFVTKTVDTEVRNAQSLIGGITDPLDEMVVVCSWCKKIQVGLDVWQEVEEAVRTLEIFEKDLMPSLSHGICTRCYDEVIGKVEE